MMCHVTSQKHIIFSYTDQHPCLFLLIGLEVKKRKVEACRLEVKGVLAVEEKMCAT